MNPKTVIFLVALCSAGFFTGFTARRLASPGKASAVGSHSADQPGSVRDAQNSAENFAARQATISMEASGVRSSETMESLLASEDGALFGRLALWMLDASEEEIAAYWQTYRQRDNRSNEINDLIFINWTRLNPAAAIAAANGTPDEHYAWWAWACHDPQAALAAAIANHPNRVGNVTWGIGEFHGDWLRQNWDLVPEESRDNAIAGLTKWDDAADPLEILEFLKKNGGNFNQRMFEALARKDPWAAYDWLQENSTLAASNYGNTDQAMDPILKNLAESDPDALDRLARQTPSGSMKRKMEATIFENLLKTDPDAALQQAKEEKAPRIAAERLAKVGLSLVKADPEKAFEIAADLFAVTPDALSRMTYIQRPDGGSSGSGGALPGVNELVDALMAKDPERIMEMHNRPLEEDRRNQMAFGNFADKWADQDLPAYTRWVNEKADPSVREHAASVVINKLSNQQLFEEAADWAMSMETPENHLQNIFQNWARANPDEAHGWLQSADLPDGRKNRYEKMLDNP